jgi:hypothetical protein
VGSNHIDTITLGRYGRRTSGRGEVFDERFERERAKIARTHRAKRERFRNADASDATRRTYAEWTVESGEEFTPTRHDTRSTRSDDAER